MLFQCKELYFCVKDAMEKAAARNNGRVPGKQQQLSNPTQRVNSENDNTKKWIVLSALDMAFVSAFFTVSFLCCSVPAGM